MTSTFYTRAKATADRLISKYGKKQIACTLNAPGVPTGPNYDPQPGVLTPNPCTLVELDYSDWVVDGTTIRAMDKRVLIMVGTLTIAPDETWTLTIDTTEYEIVRLKPLQPGDLNLLWDAQIRAR